MNAFDKSWRMLKNEPRFEYLGTHDNYRDVGLLHYPSSVTGKIRSMPFYRSSGDNSGEPGSWKFFHGVTTHPREIDVHDSEDTISPATPDKGWFIKPQVANHAFEYDHNAGQRYGHSRIKNLSEWMDNNVGGKTFDTTNLNSAQTNQQLRDNNAWGLHDMAQGIQQPQQYPANDLRSQGSGQ